MSRIDIEVKGLFATPVAAVVLPDAEARNAELAEGSSSVGGRSVVQGFSRCECEGHGDERR